MVQASLGPFESLAALQDAQDELHNALDTGAEAGDAALAGARAEIEAFVARCVATGQVLEGLRERAAAQAVVDYWTASARRAGLVLVPRRLAAFDAAALPRLPDSACPYVGLEPFRSAQHFRGRDRDAAELLALVEARPLVVVRGDSGSGKSSLVFAGLLPRLAASGVFAKPAEMTPSGGALDRLRRVLPPLDPAAPPGLARVLVIDQFEELFTLESQEAQQAFAAELAGRLAAEPTLRVVLTVRSEFGARVGGLEAFRPWRAGPAEDFVMRPLGASELQAAILEPAQAVGLQFGRGVVEDLVDQVVGQPTALPLLQFALQELWKARDHNRITDAVYAAAIDRSPLQALSRSANSFFDALAPEEAEEVRRVLLELVWVNDKLEAYRLPVPLSKLLAAGKANTARVLDRLVAERLVSVEGESEANALVSIRHEALLRNWDRLVEWIDEKRESFRARLGFAAAAQRWADLGRPEHEGLLASAWILEEAARWEGRTEVEEAYLGACLAEQGRRKNAEMTRLKEQAQAAKALAERERANAESARLNAERERANAERERANADEQGRVALKEREAAAVAQAAAAREQRAAEEERSNRLILRFALIIALAVASVALWQTYRKEVAARELTVLLGEAKEAKARSDALLLAAEAQLASTRDAQARVESDAFGLLPALVERALRGRDALLVVRVHDPSQDPYAEGLVREVAARGGLRAFLGARLERPLTAILYCDPADQQLASELRDELAAALGDDLPIPWKSSTCEASRVFELRLGWGSWAVAVPVDGLSSGSVDDDPTLTEDGLELYFSSSRSGGPGGQDIWKARRRSLTEPFGAPEPVAELSSPRMDSNGAVSADGLTFTFTSTRGGAEDIWLSERKDRRDPWGEPVLVRVFSSTAEDWGARFSPDGKLAVICSTRRPAKGEGLFLALLGPSGGWGASNLLGSLDSPGDDCDGSLDAAGNLFFSRSLPGVKGGDIDLYVASLTEDGSGVVEPVRALNTPYRETDPWISPDGRTLYFSSNRGGSSEDLWWTSRRLIGEDEGRGPD